MCMKYCSSVLHYQLQGSYWSAGHCTNLWFTFNKATAQLPTNLLHVPDRTAWALAGLYICFSVNKYMKAQIHACFHVFSAHFSPNDVMATFLMVYWSCHLFVLQFMECIQIGRDLVRLLQGVARYRSASSSHLIVSQQLLHPPSLPPSLPSSLPPSLQDTRIHPAVEGHSP